MFIESRKKLQANLLIIRIHCKGSENECKTIKTLITQRVKCQEYKHAANPRANEINLWTEAYN